MKPGGSIGVAKAHRGKLNLDALTGTKIPHADLLAKKRKEQEEARKENAHVRPRIKDRTNHAISTYKETRGDKMIQFCQTLKIPDGPFVGQPVVLRDWQCNIVKSIYDPVDDAGLKKVREAIVTMGRKNAKTALCAMLSLGHLIGPEAVRNSQIYSAGFESNQALLIYDSMSNMIDQDGELIMYTRRNKSLKTITCVLFNSRYRALSSEARSKHGFNPNFVILDELAQFGADSDLYDALKTSTGAQNEALVLVISTQAGSDADLLSQLIDYGRGVNEGTIQDDSFVLIEYSVPLEDNIFDEQNWYKANPALGDFRSLEEMRKFAARAEVSPSAERTFRQLYLNQRVTGASALIAPSTWKANIGQFTVDDLKGQECIVAADLSSRRDLTALVAVFPIYVAGIFQYYMIYPEFFTPEADIEDRQRRERVPYYDWWKLGHLNACPGSFVDYGIVGRKLLWMQQNFNIKAVVYDRWRMDIFKREFDLIDGADSSTLAWIKHGQGFKEMGPAVDALEEALIMNKVRHNNNPVMNYCSAMVVAVKDPAGGRKLDKVKSRGCIDGIVAMTMGISAYSRNSTELIESPGSSVYDSRPPIVI